MKDDETEKMKSPILTEAVVRYKSGQVASQEEYIDDVPSIKNDSNIMAALKRSVSKYEACETVVEESARERLQQQYPSATLSSMCRPN